MFPIWPACSLQSGLIFHLKDSAEFELGCCSTGRPFPSASWATCHCTGRHPRTLLAWVNGLEARWVWQEGKIGASTTCWPRAKRPMQFLSWLFGGGSGSPKEPEKSEDEAPAVSKGTIVRYDEKQARVSLLLASLLGLIAQMWQTMRHARLD